MIERMGWDRWLSESGATPRSSVTTTSAAAAAQRTANSRHSNHFMKIKPEASGDGLIIKILRMPRLRKEKPAFGE